MSVPVATLFGVFLRIGLLSFGGPAGQIATMHRILVEEKRWLDEPRFLHALNFCMLLPGPEAQQLATYAGWLVGVVTNLALWFAVHVLFDRVDGLWPDWSSARPLSMLLTLAALVAVLRFRLGLVWLLVLWGGAGGAVTALGG